jgi:uncharacterized membrane protein (DUF485 family)
MNHAGTSQPPPTPEEWDRIAKSKTFSDLLAARKKFIVPAFILFFLYFELLFVLVGYAPNLMRTRVLGTINLAYLFALSQFVVGWFIAWLYLRASARFDSRIQGILDSIHPPRGGN